MRKLPDASLARLCEAHDGEPPAAPTGLAPVIRSGQAQLHLTPAGLFALRTGFAPSALELTLLDALVRGIVRLTNAWRTDERGRLRDAPGIILGQFRRCGLAARGRKKGTAVPHHAADAGRELAAEMVARFGEGWASDPSLCGKRIMQ